MALFSNPHSILCTTTPFPKKHFSQNIKPYLLHCRSNLDSQHWKITSDHESAKDINSPTVEHSMIGDNFLIEQLQMLKACKNMLRKERSKAPFEGLVMVDAIQRLGLDYHFQEEIQAILDRHYDSFRAYGGNDLHKIALPFRLLRQGGYYVSAGVFDRFKGEDMKLNRKLIVDIEGLMDLYEASQLSIAGEDILDEASDYCYRTLNSWQLTHHDSPQASLVRNTLAHPHHKSLARFMANQFFSDLQGQNGWIGDLKKLAKLDFKVVQCQYQQEIVQISKWWRNLGLSKELKFARDQPLKWYTWSIACLEDPCLSEQRIELTKPISFIYIIDDIFDVCGTLEELTLFTEVVNRWDIAAAEQLPDYMKICFRALNSITNEISDRVYKDHGWNPVHSLRKSWATLCNAFLVEANWFASGNLPNYEDYLKNGIISSGVHVVLVHIFFLLGQGISKENVEIIDNNPDIISSTATILRLWDDLGSAKDEEQEGYDGSYIKCYLKQHKGLSFEDAQKQVIHMISDAWKHLNQECFTPNPFCQGFTKACLNLARMVPLMYNYDEKHRLPSLEEHLNSLLYEGTEETRKNPSRMYTIEKKLNA